MRTDVVVVGAGIGGLCAAIELAARGLSVVVVERLVRPGGKANLAVIDGVEVDTGPSVLTLPDVWRGLFLRAGSRLEDEVVLRPLSPATRYVWPDGRAVDVHTDPTATLDSVREALGPVAAEELRQFLAYARQIWQAAAPHFVYGPAPTLPVLARIFPWAWRDLLRIDSLRSMDAALDRQVRDPALRMLLRRFATYNGSDPRRAPATLHCIAHVELGIGVYGVQGGIYALVRALVRVAERLGVQILCDEPVHRLEPGMHGIAGVRTAQRQIQADQVVVNAEVAHLVHDLLPPTTSRRLPKPPTPSMSGWVGILRARRTGPDDRVGHTVLFPADYTAEFADIFDRDRPPQAPTVYLCAQERCHGRSGWDDDEPIFAMANAPAEPEHGERAEEVAAGLREAAIGRLREHHLIAPDDTLVWERSPAGLAAAFPRSRGAIYGAASNDLFAAFRRPANRAKGVRGLYLASGSAHPGGGLPLCALSGHAAAQAVIEDRGLSPSA
jgi:phytoene desaturase